MDSRNLLVECHLNPPYLCGQGYLTVDASMGIQFSIDYMLLQANSYDNGSKKTCRSNSFLAIFRAWIQICTYFFPFMTT